MQPEWKTNVQVPAVELHDPLLHLLLVRQQPVYPQEVPVCDIIIVADLRCCVTERKKKRFSFNSRSNNSRVWLLSVDMRAGYQV